MRTPQKELLPQARAWVDLEPDGDLCSEFEVPLHRDGEWRWVGVMGFLDPSTECFFYRLGIVADPGAEWSLRVRDRSTGRELLFDTDTLTSPKCWLIGSCSVRPSAERGVRRPRTEFVHDRSAPQSGDANVVFLAHRRPK